MDISTGSWFKYLREEVLTEGLRDIGLPESVIDFIENGMANAPEKSKTYVGNEWKKSKLNSSYADRYIDEVWHKFMLRIFRDQIEGSRPFGMDQDSQVQARTHAVYDERGMEVGPTPVGVKYDEETLEQNKMVAFVVKNVDTVVSKPLGTWRKSFAKAVKALSKAGIPSEKVEAVKNELDRITIREFRSFWNRYDILFSWLNDEPTNYEMIKGEEKISNAYDTAQKDLNNKEDPDNIIHTFEDGSYWYNLQVSNCPVEGERMGHCGGDSRGVLVSLRKREGGRKASSSYVTMTWDDETLWQIKGRSNDAPPEKIWPNIAWFINNMGITSVEETGEHSNDHNGFVEMNEWLAEECPNATFNSINLEERMEAIGEAIHGIDERFGDQRNELEWTDIGCTAEDSEEMGAPGVVYLYMSCQWSVDINLGWAGFVVWNHEYIPTLGPDDTTQDEGYETIPQDTYGDGAREFRSEIGLDDISYETPGESPEADYEVIMQEGMAPDNWQLGDPDPVATAHLRVRITNSETETANEDNDASEYDQFADTMLEFDKETEGNREKLRSVLAEGGYSVKTSYDRDRAEMSAYDLGHWKVWSESGPGIEFWFKPETSADTLVPAGEIPTDLMMWGPTGDRQIAELYSHIFGVRNNGKDKYTSDDLNRNMARALEKEYKNVCGNSTEGQQELCFGDEYTAKFVPIVLARDSRFVVEGAASYYGRGTGAYPEMPIGWRYTIGADSSASDMEIETVKSIVKYFNEHPEMVMTAAQEVIGTALEGTMAIANTKKESVMSGKLPQAAIRDIDSRYGAAADAGADTNAEHIILITLWIKDNFDRMSAPERWVAWHKYLDPLKRGAFSVVGHPIDTDGANTGKPNRWDDQVRTQMMAMRAPSATVRAYGGVPQGDPASGAIGESRPVQESMEEQIARIDRMLSEDADVRLYSIELSGKVDRDRIGQFKLLTDEIRGITGVTTVTVQSRTDLPHGRQHIRISLKYKLLGQDAREIYVIQELIPRMNKIKGLDVGFAKGSDWSTPQEITPGRTTKIQEAAVVRSSHPSSLSFNTPRDSLNSIVADWAEGGVMAYDAPMDANNMRYHVMMPVAELMPLCSRQSRAPEDIDDGMYQDFIANGAQMPIYIAIGMDGKVKITGNEDIVRYAERSGLEDVPVFFSYQRQI